jgi:hypothetical protein
MPEVGRAPRLLARGRKGDVVVSRESRTVLIGVLCGLVTVGMLVFSYKFFGRHMETARAAELPKLKDFARRYTAA